MLHQDNWKYQKVLLKPDLNPSAETALAVIMTLIYGVHPVGNMCEEVIKLQAESNAEKFPEVTKMLLKRRYVNDLGDLSSWDEMTDMLINESTKVLVLIQMYIMGWARSGNDPPKKLCED